VNVVAAVPAAPDDASDETVAASVPATTTTVAPTLTPTTAPPAEASTGTTVLVPSAPPEVGSTPDRSLPFTGLEVAALLCAALVLGAIGTLLASTASITTDRLRARS
jgi:hypothetical protein